MNPVYSDHEILDRVEADIRTTMDHLKARTLAQFGDLQTMPRSKFIVAELTAEEFDMYADTLVHEVVKFWRAKLPEETEFRADMAAHDRQIAKGE